MNFRRCFPPSAIDNCSYMYMYLYVSLVLLYVTLWVKTDCCANFCDSLKLSTWHKDIEDDCDMDSVKSCTLIDVKICA